MYLDLVESDSMWLIYILQILFGAIVPIGLIILAVGLSISRRRNFLLSAIVAVLVYCVPDRFGQYWLYWSELSIVTICLSDRRLLRHTILGFVSGIGCAIGLAMLELSNHPLLLVDKVDAIQSGLCMTALGVLIGYFRGKKRIEHAKGR
jgi:hypothetical protein